MNYYKYSYQKYDKPEYWLENRARYAEKYEKLIQPRLAEIQQWLDEGESTLAITKKLHTSNHTMAIFRYLYPTELGAMFDKAIEKRRTKEQEVKKGQKPGKSKETLCWHCYHIVPNRSGTKGCEWSMYDKPVPGWDATETTLTVGMGNVEKSYCVHSCPKFRKFIRRKYI